MMTLRRGEIFLVLFLFLISGMGFYIFSRAQESVEIEITAKVQFFKPTVKTDAAAGIEIDLANLHGELLSLGPEPQADVFFQYRKKGAGAWSETTRRTKLATTTYSETVTNLQQDSTYEFRAAVEWGAPLEQNFGDILEFTTGKGAAAEPSPAPWPSSGLLSLTELTFEGRAYPQALITILQEGQPITHFFSDPSGLFRGSLIGIVPGTYNFAVQARDEQGLNSIILTFKVNVIDGALTTVSGIFIPPTIDLGTGRRMAKGSIITISGYGFPESKIQLFLGPLGVSHETKAGRDGKWFFRLDTSTLELGGYQIRVKAVYGEEESVFSGALSFWLLPEGFSECQGADLNFDKRVNLVDFSILLYFWGQSDPQKICADINFDGLVDITDFSIMMYEWTG